MHRACVGDTAELRRFLDLWGSFIRRSGFNTQSDELIVNHVESTISRTLAQAVRHFPATPLLTFYDDASGDRTELSGATLDNWVSKTANMLLDGVGLAPGDRVAVLMPPHWQTAAILLGIASAGLAADLGDQPGAVDALFTTPSAVPAAAGKKTLDRYATGLLPLAMPLRSLPDGYQDYVLEVRNYGDHFGGAPAGPDDAAVLSRADVRAAELGITAGDRVLIDAGAHPDPVDWLYAPLVAGASIVLCVNLDPAKLDARTATEKVTRTLPAL
jgi:uncharacterized protein (TIGR03089 family)